MTTDGTHAWHCCRVHGCKYGKDEECPVVLGTVKQELSECQIGYDLNEPCQTAEELAEEAFPDGEFSTLAVNFALRHAFIMGFQRARTNSR